MNDEKSTPKNEVLTPEDYREMAEKKAAGEVTRQLIEKHLEYIMDVREQFPLDGMDLVSSNIISQQSIPDLAQKNIAALQTKMRSIIENAALRIEMHKYKYSEEALAGMELSYKEKSRADSLIKAEKNIHVSCQSLKIAIDYFSELNTLVVDKIKRAQEAGDVNLERSMVLGNAILVYELTDFLIAYIESFKLLGLDDVTKLHADMKSEVEKLRHEERRRLNKYQSGDKSKDIDKSVRDNITSDVKSRLRSFDILEKEWDGYIEQIRGLRTEAGNVGTRIPTLKAIRDNAQGQIKFLQAAAVLNIVKSNLDAVHASISTLADLKLVSLSPERVRRLLGITVQSPSER